MARNNESIIQKWIVDYLTRRFEDKLYIFKVPQGQYTSRRGIPDLIGSVSGRFFAIEVKTESGHLTALQKHEIEKITKTGTLAYVVYGKDEWAMEHICKELEP